MKQVLLVLEIVATAIAIYEKVAAGNNEKAQCQKDAGIRRRVSLGAWMGLLQRSFAYAGQGCDRSGEDPH